jgi:hypothetical protein
MRFLSLSRPWTWAIFDPVANKGVENRSWMPPVEMIGERFAIQASKSWDHDAITLFFKLGLTHFPNRKDKYPSGVIVGVATLDRVVTTAATLPPEQARWFFGECGWVLTDRIALPSPVACPGALGLRILPMDVTVAVIRQLDGMSR